MWICTKGSINQGGDFMKRKIKKVVRKANFKGMPNYS